MLKTWASRNFVPSTRTCSARELFTNRLVTSTTASDTDTMSKRRVQQLEEQLAVLQKNFAAVMSENLQRTHEVDEARAAAKAEAMRASELHSAALSAAEQKAQAHAGEVKQLNEAIADLKAKHAVEVRPAPPRQALLRGLPPLPASASTSALHPSSCCMFLCTLCRRVRWACSWASFSSSGA